MTNPISGNSSLVPRRREEWEQEDVWREIDRVEEKGFVGYAPPGTEWRAKVRRLPEDSAAAPTLPVTVDPKSRTNGGVQVIRDDGNKLVLRIEAEVTVLGELPREGVSLETMTVLRRPNASGENR
ncbi:MAG: hypothetical protein V2A56_09160 [bacterium]